MVKNYVTFTVKELPPPPPGIHAEISGPALLTSGALGTYTAAITGGMPPYSFVWYIGDPSSANGSIVQELHASWMPAGSYLMSLLVTDSTGMMAIAYYTVTVTGGPAKPIAAEVLVDQIQLGSLAIKTLATMKITGTDPAARTYKMINVIKTLAADGHPGPIVKYTAAPTQTLIAGQTFQFTFDITGLPPSTVVPGIYVDGLAAIDTATGAFLAGPQVLVAAP